MSDVAAAGLASSSGSAGTVRPAPERRAGDSEAIPGAKQALAKAQARVDADRCAHSPSCVAFDQKGVDAASAAVAQAESTAQIQASTRTQAQAGVTPSIGAVSIIA